MSMLLRRQSGTATPLSTAGARPRPVDGLPPRAEWSRLARQYRAYREGRLDGRCHSLEEAAEHFGLDPAFARTVDGYLAAQERLRLSRAGWRAGLPRGW